jgi:hypothetical protein
MSLNPIRVPVELLNLVADSVQQHLHSMLYRLLDWCSVSHPRWAQPCGRASWKRKTRRLGTLASYVLQMKYKSSSRLYQSWEFDGHYDYVIQTIQLILVVLVNVNHSWSIWIFPSLSSKMLQRTLYDNKCARESWSVYIFLLPAS